MYPGWVNYTATQDLSISATKLAGRHTLKAGFYWNQRFKAQNLGIGGALPFHGRVDFGQDSNNPIDSGFGFANAALGVFTPYSQQSKFIEGDYIYNNIEWLHAGQLEDERPDDARLRGALRPSAAEVRQIPAGLELPP